MPKPDSNTVDAEYVVTSDTSDTPKPSSLVKLDAFEGDIKELLYEIWLFLADRNAAKALKVLERQLDVVSPEDIPLTADMLPSVRTLQRWIKAEGWEERANQHIASTAKFINDSQVSRMFVISDLALSFAHQLLEDGFNKNDHAGVLAVKWDAAKEMLRFRGLGTAGVVGAPTLEVRVTAEQQISKELTVEERSEALRQGTLRRQEERRLTGRVKE
jgi:hypothetical protein